ncbi:MAG: hypothetical protein CVT47_03380, partial [Thermoplasmata archaeon HGW-Thermoplasmata-2]
MSKIQRAFRNVWRRKTRSVLVITAIALVTCMIVAVNMGVDATKAHTEEMVSNYESHINEMKSVMEAQANQLTVTPGMSGMGGMGFRPSGTGTSGATANITYDVVENISSMDLVEKVVPIATKQIMNMTAMQARQTQRTQWRNRTAGGSRQQGAPGQPGLGFTDILNYTIYGVPLNLSSDYNYHILPSDIIE